MTSNGDDPTSAGDGPYTVICVPTQRVVQVVREVTDAGEMAALVGAAFDQVRGLMDSAGAHPSGDPVATYRHGEAGATLTAAYPTEAKDVAGAELAELAGTARALSRTFVGPVADLPDAWRALRAELETRGMTPGGDSREVYREIPPDSPQAWVVQLQQPLG